MSVSTGSGDSGYSRLLDGNPLPKCDIHFEVLGSIDELSSWLGLLRCSAPEPVKQRLAAIQNTLISASGAIALGKTIKKAAKPVISDNEKSELQRAMDTLEKQLPPIREFVLPGTSRQGAEADIARTVCRRCERSISALLIKSDNQRHREILAYLNRLADYLFLLARHYDTDPLRKSIT